MPIRARITPLVGMIWAMRLSALVPVVWGATSSLTSGRFSGAQKRDLAMFGVNRGSLYALVALGYSMVYGIVGLINFAHGEVFMVGAIAGWAPSAPLGAET